MIKSSIIYKQVETMNTFYDILRIPRNATSEEILNAYRKRCIETHPDKGGNDIEFLNVRKGYEILSNPTKRAEYDKWVLKKEKEELEKEIQKLKAEKERYYNAPNNNSNVKKKRNNSNHYGLFFGIMILLVVGMVIFSEKDKPQNTTKSEQTNVQVINNNFKKDSKWLYEELSEDLHSIGTYEEFLRELQDPIMVDYYYREAKRLKLRINSKEEFYELVNKDIAKAENIQDESRKDNTSSLLDTDKIIKNANKTVNNALSGYNIKNNITNNYSEPSENITYKETKYKTGDSPYASYFGYGGKKGQFDKNSLSKLTIINHSSKEAVVLLEKTNGFVVRNVYISNNSQFTLTNIPEGYYRIKVMYGNSWNSEKNNGSNFPKGGFMKNVSFSKSKDNDLFDYTFEESYDGISYPTYSITLHKVRNGNMQTESISKDDFFN
jgi:curved DNA-binding protein CbpA